MVVDHIVDQDVRLKQKDKEIEYLRRERDELRVEMERLVQHYELKTWGVA